MVIITDAGSATDLFEKYSIGNAPDITVIAGKNDTFSPETVKALLEANASIVTLPDGASKAFAFGLAINKLDNQKTTYVITADSEIGKTAELIGFQTQLPKRGVAKGKTQTRRSRTLTKPAQSDAPKNPEADPKVSEKEKTKAANQTTKTRQVRPKNTDTEPAKKTPPKAETVYADNSHSAGAKPSAAFVKAISKSGVDKKDAQGVWDAIAKSSASIVYDMQLRLCLLDADKAKDIYGKTRDMFDSLKKMQGELDA